METTFTVYFPRTMIPPEICKWCDTRKIRRYDLPGDAALARDWFRMEMRTLACDVLVLE